MIPCNAVQYVVQSIQHVIAVYIYCTVHSMTISSMYDFNKVKNTSGFWLLGQYTSSRTEGSVGLSHGIVRIPGTCTWCSASAAFRDIAYLISV